MRSRVTRPGRGGLRSLIAVGGLPALAVLALSQPVGADPAWAMPPPVLEQALPSNCAPAPEAADRQIRPGICLRSTLGAGDPQIDSYIHYEDFRLVLAEGETVQIEMDSIAPGAPPQSGAATPPAGPGQSGPSRQAAVESRGFDTYLEVRRPGAAAPIAINDDRPGSLNSRLIFTARSAGDYVVRARALGGGTGDYLLAVRAAPSPPQPVALSGDRAEGTLDSTSPVSESRGSTYRYVVYSFDGGQGDLVRVDLSASVADGYLQLLDSDGAERSSGYGPNASLVALLAQAGRYLIRVELEVADRPSLYALTVARRTAGPPAQPRRVRPGATIDEALSIQSDVSLQDDGSGQIAFFYRLYALQVRAGEPLTVDVEATGPEPRIDPVVDAGTSSALGFAPAASDDDGGEGLNSRLVLRPERSGTVYLRVRSLGLGLGAFQLRVAPGAAAAAD